MDPHTAVAVTLVICLILLIAVYFLGFSTGRTLCAVVTDPKGRSFRPSPPAYAPTPR
jgi:hypothetical protein